MLVAGSVGKMHWHAAAIFKVLVPPVNLFPFLPSSSFDWVAGIPGFQLTTYLKVTLNF